jgi:hypothetical protein
MTSYYATRNRAIKTTLEAAFGKGKVSVRGSRGSAAGWVTIDIDWTPLDQDQSRRMHAEVKSLLAAAKINLGTCYTDDDCRYEMDKCHLNFNRSRYYSTMRASDGTLLGRQDAWESEWEPVTPKTEPKPDHPMDDFNYVGSRHHY